MKTWELLEMVLKKPLEEVVDLVTGEWKCGFCKDKKKYFSKEKLLEAAKEKANDNK